MKIVKVPGSCGELVQGIDEVPFLITCPIDLYSKAEISETLHRNEYKIAKARRLTLEYLGMDKWLNMKVTSQLLKGKGMASSTADVISAICLTAWECNRSLTDEEIGKIAIKVEPTDGVFVDGIVKYAYRNGVILQKLGTPPPMKILIFDEGGYVNTIKFNQNPKLLAHYTRNKKPIMDAAKYVTEGLKEGDVEKIGKGAVLSSIINQCILRKKNLEDVLFISERCGAIGVNVAHSGTIMGVMFREETEDYVVEECKKEILTNLKSLTFISEQKIIGGNIQKEIESERV